MHDSEAEIYDIQRGTGRCEGMMGALFVKDTKSGVKFRIGSGFTDKMRKNPPKIGTVVTYKYQNLSNAGNPRFPIFLRVYEEL